jgi:catalase (peroxidase I)
MALAVSPAASLCPFGFGSDTKLPAGHPTISPPLIPPTEPSPEYTAAMHELDIGAVQEDLKKLMTDSQDWWPADYGNYGPFFIRLAWHCSGSYRETDGRGGCSGGRQRFDPERSWEDNTNLDKARRLLWPIKEKYGLGLSWGDLFVMAGTTAIESMGGPTLGVCVGRVDDEDGSRSEGLMPSDAHPCTKDGDCEKPMGATTVGLIYVNPEGPMGNPIPDQSALQIRDTFARMGMNDEETVALIGGGHTFGKTHGACDKGAGLSPAETEAAGGNGDTEAWQGNCGTGKGKDTFTSGQEGAWTTNPTKWDNSYFRNLLQWKWDVHKGPGGHYQWKVDSAYPPQAPDAHVEGANQDIMMFTSDMALLEDPADKYQALVKEFASNPAKLDEVFAKAWHKLTTRAFGAQKAPRCVTKSKQGKSWATNAALRTGATCSA